MTRSDPNVPLAVSLSRRRSISRLSRAPAVLDHMFQTALTVSEARLTVGDDTLPIRLGFPCPATHTFEVYFGVPACDLPKPGELLDISYTDYHYQAPFLRASSLTRWRLSKPQVVTRYTARSEPRTDVCADLGFQLSIEPTPGRVIRCNIKDISPSGLFFGTPDTQGLKTDARIIATLHLPSGHEHPVMLEVRHVQREGDRYLCGALFRGISPSGATDLETCLRNC